jgi:hypothetical protein
LSTGELQLAASNGRPDQEPPTGLHRQVPGVRGHLGQRQQQSGQVGENGAPESRLLVQLRTARQCESKRSYKKQNKFEIESINISH